MPTRIVIEQGDDSFDCLFDDELKAMAFMRMFADYACVVGVHRALEGMCDELESLGFPVEN